MIVKLADISTYNEDALELAMAHLVTEDDKPVDNRFSERQHRLLPNILYASWPEGKPFVALSDVGLFTSIAEQAVVPDFMLSLGVRGRPITAKKADKSYMTWIYGKAPDLVIEVVSNRKGGELSYKQLRYARAGVPYYVVYDPFLILGKRKRKRELRVFVLTGGRYVEATSAHWLPGIGLGLTLWEGVVEDDYGRWLRFIDAEGRLLPTGEELAEQEIRRAELERRRAELEHQRAEQERQRAEQEHQRAEQERQRAEQEQRRAELAEAKAQQAARQRDIERQRAEQAERKIEHEVLENERLRQKLRELGIEP